MPANLAGVALASIVQSLNVESLEVWRGENCLFEALDFELAGGQLALLVGPNGAGKTTLLRVLAGLTLPNAGSVTWGGTSIRQLPPERRGQIGFLGHADGLKRDLTVLENLDFAARVRPGATIADVPIDALRLRGALQVRVRHLSAGQRRRAAFACLSLAATSLWILDEPLTHLDRDGRKLIVDWLHAHVGRGGAAIVATHQPDALAVPGTLIVEL